MSSTKYYLIDENENSITFHTNSQFSSNVPMYDNFNHNSMRAASKLCLGYSNSFRIYIKQIVFYDIFVIKSLS